MRGDGERLVRCLTGGEIDRVPFGVGLGWNPWGQTLQRWRQESGNPELDVARELAFDVGFIAPAVALGAFPTFKPEVLAETSEFIVSRNEQGIITRNRKDGGSMPEFLEHPVKTPADWDRFKTERLTRDEGRLAGVNWEDFRERVRMSGAAVRVGDFPWGLFGTPRDLLGAEGLLVGFYDEPEMIRDMMTHLVDLWLWLWERIAAQVTIDHIHIWEDMSGRQGSLISPAMVEEFMLPGYERIADFAQAHRVRMISVDTDGDCSELVPLMMKSGVNVFFPFEVQAGNDIREYRRRYPALGIWGGLDKRALARGHEDIDREVEKAAEMIRLGRYVPAFDHLIPPDVAWENFCYAAKKLRVVCCQ